MKETDKEAVRWFDQAMDDYRFVEWVQKEKRFFDKGCFLAQQSGEKALKACLYASGERRVIGHSLFELILKLIKISDEFKSIQDQCKRLDRFYIPTRYPNGLPGGSPYQVYSDVELHTALADLQSIIEVTQRFMNAKNIK